MSSLNYSKSAHAFSTGMQIIRSGDFSNAATVFDQEDNQVHQAQDMVRR